MMRWRRAGMARRPLGGGQEASQIGKGPSAPPAPSASMRIGGMGRPVGAAYFAVHPPSNQMAAPVIECAI